MIDLVYIGNSDYAAAIKVSAESALRHAAKPADIRIHVVTDDPSFPDIGYDIRRWDGGKVEPWHGTKLVWSRIDFGEIFYECDWVVSCDGDTLWMDDPSELWALRDENLLLQASRDVKAADGGVFEHYSWWGQNNLSMPVEKCYCCGLMLLNLRRMRRESFADKCRQFVNAHPDPPLREQTVMCYVAREASASLPPEWGVFSFWHTTVVYPKLVHYVQDLPWKRDKVNRLMSDIVLEWWKECDRLGLSNQFSGYRGCSNVIDYIWRRILYVLMKPFAGILDRISWLRPHFRNARGLNR